MNLAKLGVNFTRRHARYEKRKEKLQKEIDAMNRRHRAVSYKSAVLVPIAKAILRELQPEFKDFEIMGPFGLCNEYSLRFFKNKLEEHNANEDCVDLSFVDFDREGGKLFIRDYSRKRDIFDKDSIGEVNGMNYENVEVPPEADAQWFINLLVAFRLRNSA